METVAAGALDAAGRAAIAGAAAAADRAVGRDKRHRLLFRERNGKYGSCERVMEVECA